MQYIQIRVAGSLLTVSSLTLAIPVLFVCLGNTGHKGGDLTQAGEATVFHTQTTEGGSKGGRDPVGASRFFLWNIPTQVEDEASSFLISGQ